jgi:hypothetical protein
MTSLIFVKHSDNLGYSQVSATLLGEHSDHIHVHNLLWDSKYLAKIQTLEVKQNSPLPCHDIKFKHLNTKWIHKPGVHIVMSRGLKNPKSFSEGYGG